MSEARMKALIVGSKGQLGRGLAATAPEGAEIVGHDIDTLDITDAASVDAAVASEKPDLILNAAAYTAVDKAEGDEDAAYAVNAIGLLADAAAKYDARLVHVSTDFIFDRQGRDTLRGQCRDQRPRPPAAVLSWRARGW